jgi:hypothetical protein
MWVSLQLSCLCSMCCMSVCLTAALMLVFCRQGCW